MTIDLKWGLPFVLPPVILGLFRAMWWLAGAAWSDPGIAGPAAVMSLFVGVAVGISIAIVMEVEGRAWRIRIGKGH